MAANPARRVYPFSASGNVPTRPHALIRPALLLACALAAAGAPVLARAQSCDAAAIFGAAVTATLPEQAQRKVHVADLNGDHIPDLVICGPDSIKICLGSLSNGQPSFGAPIAYHVRRGPTGVAIADLDGDGILAIIVACDDSGLAQFHGNGDGPPLLV